MEKNDRYKPAIIWRRGCGTPHDRDPDVADVEKGHAEYLLSGPYRLSEGGKVEVIGGVLLWTAASS